MRPTVGSKGVSKNDFEWGMKVMGGVFEANGLQRRRSNFS